MPFTGFKKPLAYEQGLANAESQFECALAGYQGAQGEFDATDYTAVVIRPQVWNTRRHP